MTWQGIQAGAHGITYGRNIWQHEYPAAVLRGLVAIVHKNAAVDEAMEIASDLAGTKTRLVVLIFQKHRACRMASPMLRYFPGTIHPISTSAR